MCQARQLVCAFVANDSVIWWARQGDEEHWSDFNYGFGFLPKSIYWDHDESVACIATAPSGLIVDTVFEQRLPPIPDGLQEKLDELGIEHEHQAADVILDEDPLLTP